MPVKYVGNFYDSWIRVIIDRQGSWPMSIQLDPMIDWCLENVGQRNKNWFETHMYFFYFLFKYKEDALAFSMAFNGQYDV